MRIIKRSDMKKLATIIAILVLALTACTGQESKQRNGKVPMTTEEKEVYSAYEAINKAMIKKTGPQWNDTLMEN